MTDTPRAPDPNGEMVDQVSPSSRRAQAHHLPQTGVEPRIAALRGETYG
jgi:hypothetical protein